MLTSGRTVAAERVRRRRRRGELGGGAAELGVSARASEAARARAGGQGRLFKARANLGTRDLRGSRGGGGAAVAPVRFGRSSGMTGGSHLRDPRVSGCGWRGVGLERAAAAAGPLPRLGPSGGGAAHFSFF